MVENKYFVTDSHCHIYPEKIASRAVAGTDNFYHEHSVGSGTVEGLIEMGDKAGIDRYIVQSVATTPHQVKSINEFIAGEVKKHPGRLVGLGTLHPDSADIKGDVAHLMSLGLRGVTAALKFTSCAKKTACPYLCTRVTAATITQTQTAFCPFLKFIPSLPL